jgi:hypothetical protein
MVVAWLHCGDAVIDVGEIGEMDVQNAPFPEADTGAE